MPETNRKSRAMITAEQRSRQDRKDGSANLCRPAIGMLGLLAIASVVSSPAIAQAQTVMADAGAATVPEGQAQLLRQADYWLAQNRPDLAEQALRRLLIADPTSPQGLAGMARVQMVLADYEAARGFLERLSREPGTSSVVATIERELNLVTVDRDALENARRLASQGNLPAAMEAYDAVLDTGDLEGLLAVEYFLTMGGIAERWEEAVAGLDRLQAVSPDDEGLSIAIARLKTYRPETRPGAVEQLLDLGGTAPNTEAVFETLRQALLWMTPARATDDLFERYLQQRPNDDEVRAHFERRGVPEDASPSVALVQRGFDALDSGDRLAAEARFLEAIASDATNADALAGLGILRGRQGRYSEAIDFLERGLAEGPSAPESYRQALSSFRFSAAIADIRARIDRGDLLDARSRLGQVSAITPASRALVESVRGEISMGLGDMPSAALAFRAALAADANSEAAFSGLLTVLLEEDDRFGLETALRDHATPVRSNDAKATLARARAYLAVERGDTDSAVRDYQVAMTLAPSDPWIRLDAARAMAQAGHRTDAVSFFDIGRGGRDPEFALAAAIFASEAQDWATVCEIERLVEPADRLPELTELVRLADVSIAVEQALFTAARGSDAAARATLLGLYSPGEASIDEALTLAAALLQIGDGRSAERLVSDGLSSADTLETEQVVGGVRILLATGALEESEYLLGALQDDIWGLSDSDRMELADLYDDLMIARARQAIEAGALGNALDLALSVHDAAPTHSGALRVLGEVNVAAGRVSEGIGYYRLAYEVDPQDMDALRGAVGALASHREFGAAHDLLDVAMRQSADLGSVYRVRADVFRAQGKLRDALEALEQARGLLRMQGQGPAGSPFGRSSGNPFRGGEMRRYADRSGPGPDAQPVRLAGFSPSPSVPVSPALVNDDARWLQPQAPAPQWLRDDTSMDRQFAGAFVQDDALDSDIARLEREVRPATSERFALRWREGEAGFSALTELSLPVDFATTLGDGRLTATVQPVFLTAGSAAEDSGTLRRAGSLAAVAPSARSDMLDSSAGGVGMNVAYDLGGLHADIGTTPLGFETSNVVGGLSFSGQLGGGLSIDAGIARRAVTDSLLSFGGLVDPASGQTFGGVTDNRVRIGAAYDIGGASLYLTGAGIQRDGNSVVSNQGLQFDSGVRLPISDRYTTGFNLTYFGFEENLRYFTLGHGGYFSPQTFVAATVPFDFVHETERLRLDVRNAIGVQFYEEDDAPFYPGRPGLMQTAQTVLDTEIIAFPDDPSLTLSYDGETATSLALRSSLAADYQLNPSFSLTGLASVDRAADWTEFQGQIGLKYLLGRGSSQ
ncbi:MAG: cellulose synthase subunit BcsC-related outer membrane protein [Pseudomonadota bacterium]